MSFLIKMRDRYETNAALKVKVWQVLDHGHPAHNYPHTQQGKLNASKEAGTPGYSFKETEVNPCPKCGKPEQPGRGGFCDVHGT